MTVDELFADLHKTVGGVPDDYLVFDVETSGVTPTDLILQIGHCLVRGRKVVDWQSFCLDWRQAAGRLPDRCEPAWACNHRDLQDGNVGWLKTKILDVEQAFRQKGLVGRITWERLAREGNDPLAILGAYRDWFQEVADRGQFFLAHNGYMFDCRLFEAHFANVLGRPFTFGENAVLDTGTLLKAAQVPTTPRRGESLRAFSGRVAGFRRRGLRWSLSEFAVPLFGLKAKFDGQADSHDAGHDAVMAHLLFEELRALAARQLPLPV